MTPGLPMVPYPGLVPYTEVDARAFFGREREIRIVTDNLLARRISVMYGPSGAGKTSLLRAGVVPSLAWKIGSRAAVVMFNAWQGDPVDGLLHAVRDELARRFDRPTDELIERPQDLAGTLERWTQNLDVELVIILDQFEQYFLHYEIESGSGTFADEFPRAARRSALRASFLICLREEWLFKLDRWKYSIPKLFDALLRVEYLTVEAAQEVIVGSLQLSGVRAEEALVEAVLKGIGSVSEVNHARGISPVHLQIVMREIWDAARYADSSVLRLESLSSLGGPSHIIENYATRLIERLTPRQQGNLARMLRFLVTPSGVRLALTTEDIGALADVSVSEVRGVLDILTDARVLRLFVLRDDPGRYRYELSHDFLVPTLFAWSAKYALQEKWGTRKVQAMLLAIALGIAIAFGFWLGRLVL